MEKVCPGIALDANSPDSSSSVRLSVSDPGTLSVLETWCRVCASAQKPCVPPVLCPSFRSSFLGIASLAPSAPTAVLTFVPQEGSDDGLRPEQWCSEGPSPAAFSLLPHWGLFPSFPVVFRCFSTGCAPNNFFSAQKPVRCPVLSVGSVYYLCSAFHIPVSNGRWVCYLKSSSHCLVGLQGVVTQAEVLLYGRRPSWFLQGTQRMHAFPPQEYTAREAPGGMRTMPRSRAGAACF